MAYPQPSSFMSPQAYSAWITWRPAGGAAKACGSDGWSFLRDLQEHLKTRLQNEPRPLVDYDGVAIAPEAVAVNSYDEPQAQQLPWKRDLLRALYAVSKADRAPAAMLDRLKFDAGSQTGPIEPTTLALAAWQLMASPGTGERAVGSPDQIQVPQGITLPSKNQAPPLPPTFTSGLSCVALSTTAPAEVTPAAPAVVPYRPNTGLVIGLLAVAAVAALALSSRALSSGESARANPESRRRGRRHHRA